MVTIAYCEYGIAAYRLSNLVWLQKISLLNWVIKSSRVAVAHLACLIVQRHWQTASSNEMLRLMGDYTQPKQSFKMHHEWNKSFQRHFIHDVNKFKQDWDNWKRKKTFPKTQQSPWIQEKLCLPMLHKIWELTFVKTIKCSLHTVSPDMGPKVGQELQSLELCATVGLVNRKHVSVNQTNTCSSQLTKSWPCLMPHASFSHVIPIYIKINDTLTSEIPNPYSCSLFTLCWFLWWL